MSYLITDIETVTDHAVWEQPAPDPTKPDEKVVPPYYAQRPIVIGAVWLDSDLLPKKVGALRIEGGPKDNLEEPEARMLTSWNEFVERERPCIVSWYGRGFDLPVLSIRAMHHGISMPWYYENRDMRYRYSESGHLDLCDAISDYGATRNLKLDAIAKLIGLPGKPKLDTGETIDGSQVGDFFAAGRLKDISLYCMTDCLQTAWTFMRWRHLQGRLTTDRYREVAKALLSRVEAMPELSFFRKQIAEKALLLEPTS